MTDCFALMQLPNAGDDLQAIKKGVMELADMVLINKADIDPDAATRAQAQITSAMRIFENHGRDPHDGSQQRQASQRVMLLSALKETGLAEFWQRVTVFQAHAKTTGQVALRRQAQSLAWMWERIEVGLKQRFDAHVAVQQQLPTLKQQVLLGQMPASVAARQLLDVAHQT
jgi:LAO/AO transport system kinase